MKINVTIKNQIKDTEIVEIEICNGNWKYWDDYMDSTEKESLTINTINKAHYLHFPVQDVLQYGLDEEAYENGEIVYKKETVRLYHSLLKYLNCRIKNVKESRLFKDQTFECVIYDNFGRYSGRTLEEDICYKTGETDFLEEKPKTVNC